MAEEVFGRLSVRGVNAPWHRGWWFGDGLLSTLCGIGASITSWHFSDEAGLPIDTKLCRNCERSHDKRTEGG